MVSMVARCSSSAHLASMPVVCHFFSKVSLRASPHRLHVLAHSVWAAYSTKSLETALHAEARVVCIRILQLL